MNSSHSRWLLIVSLLGGLSQAGALENFSAERALSNECAISGPEVYVRAPLGFAYRPGFAFPLKVRVFNPGPEFRGEILVIDEDDGQRYGILEPELLPQNNGRFTLPLRAPNVQASLSLLVREVLPDSAVPQERFRATLKQLLKPLPKSDSYVVLKCGRRGSFQLGDQRMTEVLSAADLPEQQWMYEGVELVVLSDNTFAAASSSAKDALRHWLLGGGRVLLTSPATLASAAAAGLLPLPRQLHSPIGAERSWWQKHAGLRPENVLIQENYSPVFACLSLGHGTVAFVFPGVTDEQITRYGSEILNSPVLKRPRDPNLGSDLRVQPHRQATFETRAMAPARVGRARIWLGLGALMFFVVILLGMTSRWRLESIGLPLGLAALLAVMLVRLFPEPELVVSRLSWTRISADGRARLADEWLQIESFRKPAEVALEGPAHGSLMPVYRTREALLEARYDCLENEGRLRLSALALAPEQPALVHAWQITEEPGPAPGPTLQASGLELKLAAPLPENVQRKAAVWVGADGKFRYVENLRLDGECSIRDYDDPSAAIRRTLGSGGESFIKARATALGWATQAAAQSRGDVLVLWGQLQQQREGAIVINETEFETASDFQLYSIPLEIRRK